MKLHAFPLLFFVACGWPVCFSQSLDRVPGTEIFLSDKTRLILRRGDTKEISHQPYYYQPVNLRIASRGKDYEFLFLAYNSDDNGFADGAIMHMLLTWGLTSLQVEEADSLLKSLHGNGAFIAGALLIEPAIGKESLHIHSESPVAEMLNLSLKSKGGIPLSPGEKMALSFMFSATDAYQMIEFLENPEKLKGLFFDILYYTPAIKSREPFILRGEFQQWMENIGEKEISK